MRNDDEKKHARANKKAEKSFHVESLVHTKHNESYAALLEFSAIALAHQPANQLHTMLAAASSSFFWLFVRAGAVVAAAAAVEYLIVKTSFLV